MPHPPIYAITPAIVRRAAIGGILLLVLTVLAAIWSWRSLNTLPVYVLGAVWAVVPPAWFWYQYFYVYRVHGNSVAFEEFKYGQQTAIAIWAGVALALFAYASSERFKPPPDVTPQAISSPAQQ